ncbi:MAG: alpha/beta hydrolase [Spirochaetes bacterium]|nr:alpha/beta hydrolase [Spirochaetota bacterium]
MRPNTFTFFTCILAFVIIGAAYGKNAAAVSYPPAHVQYITNGSLRIAYEDYGTNIRGSILFIHGLDDSRTIWRPIADAFSNRYRVVMYDLKGHGNSSDGNGDYSYPALVKELRTVTVKLGLTNAAVVGHSLGAAIITHYLRAYSNDFSRIVFLDPAVKIIPAELYYIAGIISFQTARFSSAKRDDYLGLPKYKKWDRYSIENFDACYTFRDNAFYPRVSDPTLEKILATIASCDYKTNYAHVNRDIHAVIFRIGVVYDRALIQDFLKQFNDANISYFPFVHNPLLFEYTALTEDVRRYLEKDNSKK